MELNFEKIGSYIQRYMDGTLPTITAIKDGKEYQKSISFIDDLNRVSEAQRLGFLEKYIEFIEPKQLRRGTSTASSDKDFTLNEVKE